MQCVKFDLATGIPICDSPKSYMLPLAIPGLTGCEGERGEGASYENRSGASAAAIADGRKSHCAFFRDFSVLDVSA